MNRWALFIDIEGTSKLFEQNKVPFYDAFDSLLATLYSIGTKVFPETPSRLFAHQVGGDGVIVVSEFAEGRPETPISIAVILLQVLLMKGFVGKAGISEGDFGDVRSCFPSLREIQKDKDSDSRYRLGRGVLTTFPVMGTALINSHRFATRPPKGARLAIDSTLLKDMPLGVIVTKLTTDISVIDWVHTRTKTMDRIVNEAKVHLASVVELEQKLTAYVLGTREIGKTKWGQNTLVLNGCRSLVE